MATPLLAPLLIGIAAGLRTMTPPARLVEGRARPVVKLLAAGEMLADKSPAAPDRTRADAALARAISGGLAAAYLAGRFSPVGAAIGVGGAVIGTRLGLRLRRELAARAGRDWPVAIVEDMVAGGLAGLAVRMARRRH
jgi:uncharacterized membrane protein